jgi:hypothetical protein
MINRKMLALMAAALLSTASSFALVTGKAMAGSAVPPAAIPGINQPRGDEPKDEKADKKGEEASGSNSGAESHEMEKDAATSSGSMDDEKQPKP